MRIITRNIVAVCAAVLAAAQTTLTEQGRAALGRGDSAAAVEILQKAVAESPNSADAHYLLANAYAAELQKEGMFGAVRYASKVKEGYEKAVALDPKHIDARNGLVMIYAGAPVMMGGSPDKALEQAKEIKAIDPIAGHRAYALVYTQQKKPELAKQEYLDAIREHPESPKARNYFGQYLTNTEKNYAAAFDEFEAALKLDKNYMPAYFQLGRAAGLAKKNLARGEEVLKQYLGYTPKPNEPALANAYSFLGTIYEAEGKKAEARRSYESALKLNPSLKDAAEGLKRVL